MASQLLRCRRSSALSLVERLSTLSLSSVANTTDFYNSRRLTTSARGLASLASKQYGYLYPAGVTHINAVNYQRRTFASDKDSDKDKDIDKDLSINKGKGFYKDRDSDKDNSRVVADADEVLGDNLDKLEEDMSKKSDSASFSTSDDLFGLFSSNDSLGEDLPPLYERDAATGRMTGKTVSELTLEERQLLQMDAVSYEKHLVNRVNEHWKGDDDKKLLDFGERVRDKNIKLNTFGRSMSARLAEEKLEGTGELDNDTDRTIGAELDGYTNRLTKDEFAAFQAYMKKQHKLDISEDEMPVLQTDRESSDKSSKDAPNTDELELSLKWLTTRAQRQMDEDIPDNPYSDLMPGDLRPTRLVNRKRAKRIPSRLLHHNNIALLKTFISPTGQIQNRIQTRLGAREQRKIAKLIRRARCMGLIPYIGQFKVERHGWKYAKDIHEEKPWEKELARRGLIIKGHATTKEDGNEEGTTGQEL